MHSRQQAGGSKQQTAFRRFLAICCLLPAVCCVTGCTSLSEYVHNGFKVGPNYKEPPAPVAKNWIDADDKRLSSESDDHTHWWTNFDDPVLNDLICDAYKQNLTLKEAGMRILQARATRNIACGNLFPQTQQAVGDYQRTLYSKETFNANFLPQRYSSQFDYGFNLSWELDFWGRFRRAVESADAALQASVYDYDDVLVTLLGDVATNYVNMRVAEKRIEYAQKNVELQRKTVIVVGAQYKGGAVNKLGLDQAEALLHQTEATIPDLEITQRMSANALCVLMGVQPENLQSRLDKARAKIPTIPKGAALAVGVPADLLRRRPDVRRAERQAAAQCALIGVAEANFYPHIFINGEVLLSAQNFNNLFTPQAYNGVVGPTYQWNILNYGRIINGVRYQDAAFKEAVLAYQQAVLSAEQDVENGLVTYLKGGERVTAQAASVKAAEAARDVANAQFEGNIVTIAQLILYLQNLVQQQDTLALAQGETALGLVQAYKALGGGWQIRIEGCASTDDSKAPAFPPPPAPLPGDMKAKFGPPK